MRRLSISLSVCLIVMVTFAQHSDALEQWRKNQKAASDAYLQGHYERTEQLLASTLAQAKKGGAGTRSLAHYLILYGEALHTRKKYALVAKYDAEAAALLERLPPNQRPIPRIIFDCYSQLGSAYYQIHNYPAAEAALKKAMNIGDQHSSEVPAGAKAWCKHLLELLEKGKKDDAAQQVEKGKKEEHHHGAK